MFGIEDAMEYFGVKPTEQQLTTLLQVPFAGATLKSLKKTYILAAVFPLSIVEIRTRVEYDLFRHHENAWYNDRVFANEKGETYWLLVRKAPFKNSTQKSWSKQQGLLTKYDKVPPARVVTYAIIDY